MTEKDNKQRAAQITLANKYFQWGDFLQCGATKILDLFLEEILGEPDKKAIKDNRRTINRMGIYAWTGILDNATSTKFYNLVLSTDPMSWYFNRDNESKEHMRQLAEEAIETITNNLPDAEDLGAEPKETLEQHYDDFVNDADTLTNDNDDQ